MNVRQVAGRAPEPGSLPGASEPRPPPEPALPERAFVATLQRLREPPARPLRISAHAAQRIEQRGISLTDADRQTLGDALHHLDTKGARDALLLRDDAAFVVSVPNRTVVTALAPSDLQDRVFTGIDSALVL